MNKILIIILSIVIFSCNSENENNNITYKKDSNISVKNDTNTYLTIEVKDIWVRDEAGTGNVISVCL